MAKIKNPAILLTAVFFSCLALPGCSEEAQPIEVTQVEPGFVRQGDSRVEVTVRGRGFAEGAQVEFLLPGTEQAGEITIHSVRVIDSETMVVTVSADPQATPSAFDVRITFQDRVGKGTELFGIAPRQ